ncbi:TRAP transporter permease [Pelagimonas sp. KU-00592-HH]|uniref:TRAP transporter permease n=1 Tax=Pelagimonas sp. KU-00592-HH TaxID=3127651 RepID=UPI00310AC074
MAQNETAAAQDTSLEDFVADSDTGGRLPQDKFGRSALWYIPLVWSLYQLWIASPLPFILGVGVWNDTQTRAIHLGFAVLLAFIAFPGFKNSPRNRIPIDTWVIAIVGALCASYLFYAYSGVAARTGNPNTTDVAVSVVGIVLLLEAARRSLGFPLMGVALFFLAYVFFGSWDGLPEVVQWKGASLNKAMSHMWLTTEGVFGVALGVSSGFVFLFVLFGALLNQAGAGNYFLQLAFAALGHLRGGPAKAAVIASAATGLISGSSIANVVTTGTFTIPLMKKVGFPATKAGAVEVSSSINGVLTPPVMGAVAFLMTEYVGISYVEVVKTAIVPAAISYVALVYIVHLEALKMGMTGTSRMHPLKFILGAIFIIASSIVIAGGTLFLCGVIVDTLQGMFGGASTWIIVVAMAVLYVLAVRFAASRPDLEMSIESMQHLPPAREIFKTGIHYIMPILLLMYLLMIERKSPGLSAFWSAIAMLVILATQNPLKAFFRGNSDIMGELKRGFDDIAEGLIIGARNMIGLAAAMGVAGIIVGAVTLTGIGQVMAEFVEFLSGGNLLAMLFFVALISIVLGMGLPTTANYIVVSSLMAGVVVELGAQSGLIVPLVAVHMFVFYFGIMADVTPPVGLASFAAAAISKGDPLRTGFQAFFYSIRTALLPFLFIFNTDLLLIDVGPVQAVFVFVVALIAMLLFAAGTMNYFMVKSQIWESAVLLLVAFTLFQPGFWLDRVSPKYSVVTGADGLAQMSAQADGHEVRLSISGPDFGSGEITPTTIIVPTKAGDAEGALMDQGLAVMVDGGQLVLEEPFPGTPHFETLGNDYDFYGDTPVTISAIEIENERMPKEVFYLPGFLLLGLVYLLQMRRKRKETEGVPA